MVITYQNVRLNINEIPTKNPILCNHIQTRTRNRLEYSAQSNFESSNNIIGILSDTLIKYMSKKMYFGQTNEALDAECAQCAIHL